MMNSAGRQPIPRWDRGQSILIRYIWNGAVWYAIPVVVVDDTAERLIVYLQAGTQTKWTMIDFTDGSLSGPDTHIWHSTNQLIFLEDDLFHAVSLFWNANNGEFQNWYIDFQDPIQRVEDGIITFDRALDIVVSPDMKWRWKDEDHFQRIQELGWISSEMTKQIEQERYKAVIRIKQKQKPFCESWPEWRPDPKWPVPRLPDNWAWAPESD
jgi:uncharacterized protein